MEPEQDETVHLLIDDDEVVEELEQNSRSDVFFAIVNLCATTMGGGIILLPVALSYAGWLGGTLSLFVFAAATDLSMQLLVSAAKACGVYSYEELGKHLFGRAGELTVNVSLLILLLGANVTIIITIGELGSKALRELVSSENSFFTSKEFLTGASIFLISPFTKSDSIRSLRFTSSAALFALLIVFCIMLSFFLTHCHINNEIQTINTRRISLIPLCISFQSLAFCSQFNVLPIYAELKPKDKRYIKFIIRMSIVGVVFSVYTLFGMVGYFTAGNEFWIISNGHSKYDSVLVIDEYQSSSAMTAGLIAVAATNLLKLPLLFLPFRSCLNQLCFGQTNLDQTAWITETVLLLIFMYLLSIAVSTLTLAMELIGVTAGPVICYILPGAFYWKTKAGDYKGPPWFAIFGGVVLILSILFFAINQLNELGDNNFVHNSSCSE